MAGIVKRERDGELFLHIQGRYRTLDGSKYFDQLPRAEALGLLKILMRELSPTPEEIASIGGGWRPARWKWCWERGCELQVRYRFDGDVDVRKLPSISVGRSQRQWSSPWRMSRRTWEAVGELDDHAR